MKELYLECFTGISGDMTVGALLDLGADEDVLRKVLESVPIKGFQIKVERTKKSGLDVCDFDVILEKGSDNHDHDMEFLYGEKDMHHHHEHSHCHSHDHSHRTLKEITEILDCTDMTENARKTAHKIFQILAEAEAKAHGVAVQEVHFHEAGAIDSIVDVIAASVCFDNLEIDEVVIPVLYEGVGSIRCQHGILPVPVPAVLYIAETHGLPLRIIQRNGELITPTGAAIAAAMKTKEHLPEKFRIIKSGSGSGKRKYEVPSILRAMLIEEIKSSVGKL